MTPLEVMRRIAASTDYPRPLSIAEWESARWHGLIATDGFMMLMADGLGETEAPHFTGDLDRLFRAPWTWRAEADHSDLVAWCGSPLWPAAGSCPYCDDGVDNCGTCRGTGVCSGCERPCENCDEGETTCSECKGTGRSSAVPIAARFARLTRVIEIDRVRLGRILAAFPTQSHVEFMGSDDKSPIVIHADTTSVGCLMPSSRGSALDLDGGEPFLSPESIQ